MRRLLPKDSTWLCLKTSAVSFAQNYIPAIGNSTCDRKVGNADDKKLIAPCGLYCGACVDYLDYKSCHGCRCNCGTCAGAEHRGSCDIYECCVNQNGLDSCANCRDLPCSKLIQFCYSPIWFHHLPVIENLRRQKAVGMEKWLKEQREIWSNDWYLKRWLWLQKECENRLRRFKKEDSGKY